MLFSTSKPFLLKQDPTQCVLLHENLKPCLKKILHNYFKRYKLEKYFSKVNNTYIFLLLFTLSCILSFSEKLMIVIGNLTRKIMAEIPLQYVFYCY